jgi:hypothetical protein
MALQLFKIASTTVESPVTSIIFNSIPSGYTDLILIVSTRGTVAEDGFNVRFNNDAATNYTNRQINGNGSVVASTSFTQGAIGGGRQSGSDYTANTFGSNQFYITNYTSSNHKSVSVEGVNENNATTVRTQLTAGLYPSANAITRIDILPGAGSFAANSTATLYGVL